MRSATLTGRFTLRRSWSGKIVLQVEEDVRRVWPFSRWSPTRRRWRDATLMDLAQPEMRPLMDLRSKPLHAWERLHVPLRREAGPVSDPTALPPEAANANGRGELRPAV